MRISTAPSPILRHRLQHGPPALIAHLAPSQAPTTVGGVLAAVLASNDAKLAMKPAALALVTDWSRNQTLAAMPLDAPTQALLMPAAGGNGQINLSQLLTGIAVLQQQGPAPQPSPTDNEVGPRRRCTSCRRLADPAAAECSASDPPSLPTRCCCVPQETYLPDEPITSPASPASSPSNQVLPIPLCAVCMWPLAAAYNSVMMCPAAGG